MPKVSLYFVIIFFILFNYPSFAENIETKIKYEVGKPYKIKGKWYYPNNNLNYHEIGIASVNSNNKNRVFVNISTKKKKKQKTENFFQMKKYLQNIKL